MSDEHERPSCSDELDKRDATDPIMYSARFRMSMLLQFVCASQNRRMTFPVCKVDDDLFLSCVIFVKLHTHMLNHTRRCVMCTFRLRSQLSDLCCLLLAKKNGKSFFTFVLLAGIDSSLI